jgi:hypothetical protein
LNLRDVEFCRGGRAGAEPSVKPLRPAEVELLPTCDPKRCQANSDRQGRENKLERAASGRWRRGFHIHDFKTDCRMDECDLESMTVQELIELRNRVDEAIRAEIARDRRAREARKTVPGEVAPVIDLERERDAWAARRK